MTYRELLHSLPLRSFEAVGGESAEWLDQDATVRTEDDEFFPLDGVGKSKDGDPADGILDHGHLYLDCCHTSEEVLAENQCCECEEFVKRLDDSLHCMNCSTEWYFKYEGTGEVSGPMSKAEVDGLADEPHIHGTRHWRVVR